MLRASSSSVVRLFAIALFAACGGSSSKAVLGAWITNDGVARLEFFDDGRVAFGTRGETSAGSWVILKDGRLKLELAETGGTMTLTGGIAGTTLRMATGLDTVVFERSTPELEVRFQKMGSAKQLAYEAVMKSDLMKLAMAQEAYFADYQRYATALPSDRFNASEGVTITIQSATATAWSGTASHVSAGKKCALSVGGTSSDIKPSCS